MKRKMQIQVSRATLSNVQSHAVKYFGHEPRTAV